MSLRITGGTLRGRLVESPQSDKTRPTTDMWRSTIFDAFSHLLDLEDAIVVDLFAGTGILGLEALSRGASHATFVEKNPRLCKQIAATCKTLLPDHDNSVRVVNDDVFHFLTSALSDSQTLRLIFADPPYDLRCANQLLDQLRSPTNKESGHSPTNKESGQTSVTWVVIEHSPHEFIMERDGWEVLWSKEKGDTAVDILRMVSPLPTPGADQEP